jgi:hypothetical protein
MWMRLERIIHSADWDDHDCWNILCDITHNIIQNPLLDVRYRSNWCGQRIRQTARSMKELQCCNMEQPRVENKIDRKEGVNWFMIYYFSSAMMPNSSIAFITMWLFRLLLCKSCRRRIIWISDDLKIENVVVAPWLFSNLLFSCRSNSSYDWPSITPSNIQGHMWLSLPSRRKRMK